MHKIYTTFINTLRIEEIKDDSYVFSFVNNYSNDNYILKVAKELFDIAFKDRDIAERTKPFMPKKSEIDNPHDSMSS